jgi:hypothetical protein
MPHQQRDVTLASPHTRVAPTRAPAILGAVGFNPFRPQRRSYADYVMVAAALVVCGALVIWALVG